MKTVYNAAVGYERIKMYTGMGASIIFGFIMIICGIMSMISPPPPPPTPNPIPNTPTSTTTTTLGWPWLIFCGFICFVLAYGAYYMATNKSMENVLAAQGALDAASTISNIFNNNRGGMFDVGE